MNLQQFNEQILKTGFPLENRVAISLRKSGWTVISNKYYVDDNEETVREIDLLAYKAKRVQGVLVYTTLIISCKKSESNVWALLCRDIDQQDPNRNFRPLHIWSNDKALAFEISTPSFSSEYHSLAKEKGGIKALAEPAVDIFAFQEMSRSNGSPQNDKAIFSAITSLMKAQSYELDALSKRKRDACAYHFSLLSIVDADLVQIKLDSKKPSSKIIEEEFYIADYIIKKKAECFKIRIVNADVFQGIIEDYNRLHKFNCEAVAKSINNFYSGVFSNDSRSNVYSKDFAKKISSVVRWQIYEKFNKFPDMDDCSFSFKEGKPLEVWLPLENKEIEFLQGDDKSLRHIAAALKDIYRYEGKFIIDMDIPF